MRASLHGRFREANASVEALQAAIAARAIVVTINTRLTPAEVAYILEHSGPRVVLVDHEYVHLLPKPSPFPTSTATSTAPSSQSQHAYRVIVGHDTGKNGCPYEDFLSEGRRKSGEKGWEGLEMHKDENAPFCLNYTSGTTGRPKVRAPPTPMLPRHVSRDDSAN